MKRKLLDVVLIPKEERGQGKGKKLIRKLCGWADIENTELVLSADSTVCGRAGSAEEDRRLIAFYVQFGFQLADLGEIYTDSIWSSKNIMVRKPEPVLSDHIFKLSEVKKQK